MPDCVTWVPTAADCCTMQPFRPGCQTVSVPEANDENEIRGYFARLRIRGICSRVAIGRAKADHAHEPARPVADDALYRERRRLRRTPAVFFFRIRLQRLVFAGPPVDCVYVRTHGFGASRSLSRARGWLGRDRKSTRLNSSHMSISYAVFCLKKKKPQCKVTIFID